MFVEQSAEEEARIAADLVQRIGEGDRRAEAELAVRYRDRLRYVLLRQLPDRDDIDDLLQATLITTILRLRERSIARPEKLGGFIYGVLNNLRRANRRDEIKRQASSDPELLASVEDNEPGPEQQTANAEIVRIVRQLIAELSVPRDREIILRLYVHQQEESVVCEGLDIDRAHLRRVVHRAKQRLKELLMQAEQRDNLHLVEDLSRDSRSE